MDCIEVEEIISAKIKYSPMIMKELENNFDSYSMVNVKFRCNQY